MRSEQVRRSFTVHCPSSSPAPFSAQDRQVDEGVKKETRGPANAIVLPLCEGAYLICQLRECLKAWGSPVGVAVPLLFGGQKVILKPSRMEVRRLYTSPFTAIRSARFTCVRNLVVLNYSLWTRKRAPFATNAKAHIFKLLAKQQG